VRQNQWGATAQTIAPEFLFKPVTYLLRNRRTHANVIWRTDHGTQVHKTDSNLDLSIFSRGVSAAIGDPRTESSARQPPDTQRNGRPRLPHVLRSC
jgi:hypothetical protein